MQNMLVECFGLQKNNIDSIDFFHIERVIRFF